MAQLRPLLLRGRCCWLLLGLEPSGTYGGSSSRLWPEQHAPGLPGVRCMSPTPKDANDCCSMQGCCTASDGRLAGCMSGTHKLLLLPLD